MQKALSLYEQDPAAWDAIALYRPSIGEMARRFDTQQGMESALGYGPSVIVKWVRKRGGVSLDADRRAKIWLDSANKPVPPKPQSTSQPMLLVACQDAAKVTRVLQLMGCEVTEI